MRITRLCFIAALVFTCGVAAALQPTRSSSWRPATETELKNLLPARAPVEQERIETELRTASGITDGHGQFIAESSQRPIMTQVQTCNSGTVP